MKSMTGYGAGDCLTSAGRIRVELRSVNHRFLEVRIRTNQELNDFGMELEQLARQHMTRGRVEIALRLEHASNAAYSFDVERARSFFQALCSLRDELAPHTEVPFSMLTSLPNLFISTTDIKREEIQEACKKAFLQAIASLNAMRIAEGQTLINDLKQRVLLVQEKATSIAERVPIMLQIHRIKLQERLHQLIHAARLDPLRFEQEIALLVDRSDISEELTRLFSHFSQLNQWLERNEGTGRQLDFLLQEIMREVNTIGSKSQDVEIAHSIVHMKTELERMREQIQNLE